MGRGGGKALDGGYGWVIVLASFLLQALAVGVTYTFGILYVDLLEYFQSSESQTAWIGSIQPCLLYFICVIAGPLMIRFGWRIVTFAGTLVCSAGCFISYVAPNIYVLYVTYGFMTGIGYGLMYMVSMIIVQHYFDERRSLATGLAVSGSGLGTVVFGMLMGQLTQLYHWRLTVVIVGAISLGVGLICVALIRPLPQAVQDEEEIDGDSDEIDPLLLSRAADGIKQAYGSQCSRDDDEQEDEVTELGGPRRAPRNQGQSSPGRKHSETSLLPVEDQPGCSACCGSCSVCQAIDDKFRFSLCKNPVLITFCFSVVCFCFGYHVPYTFTADRAIKVFGIEQTKAAFLISIMGISNVSSRLVFGIFGDRSAALRHIMLSSVIGLCGVLNCLIFFFDTYTLLVVYSIIFGALSGCFASMIPVVLVDQMGLDVIEFTLGQVLASSALPFLIASPISGWVIEVTGSYDIPFLVVGILQIVGGIACSLLPCIRRRYSSQPEVIVPDETSIRRVRHRSRMFSETIA